MILYIIFCTIRIKLFFLPQNHITVNQHLRDIGVWEILGVVFDVFSIISEVVELQVGISMLFNGFLGDLDSCAV